MKAARGPGYERLLADLAARLEAGRPITPAELVEAIAALEPRQGEAIALRKWGVDVPTLLDLQAIERLDIIDQLRGMTFREAGKRMGISHVRVQMLVEKASCNLLGWLTS